MAGRLQGKTQFHLLIEVGVGCVCVYKSETPDWFCLNTILLFHELLYVTNSGSFWIDAKLKLSQGTEGWSLVVHGAHVKKPLLLYHTVSLYVGKVNGQ